MNALLNPKDDSLEIIAFMLHGQQYCMRTTSIREIRGWAPVTPLPYTPPDVIGVVNLRGMVIPIVDLAVKLGMPCAKATERSAIVVTSVRNRIIGMMVDRVSDILTVSANDLQQIPAAAGLAGTAFAEGIFTRDKDMIFFLNLDAIFVGSELREAA